MPAEELSSLMILNFLPSSASWPVCSTCGPPQISRLKTETEARGFSLRERLAIYPEYLPREEFLSPRVRARATHLAGENGYAV